MEAIGCPATQLWSSTSNSWSGRWRLDTNKLMAPSQSSLVMAVSNRIQEARRIGAAIRSRRGTTSGCVSFSVAGRQQIPPCAGHGNPEPGGQPLRDCCAFCLDVLLLKIAKRRCSPGIASAETPVSLGKRRSWVLLPCPLPHCSFWWFSSPHWHGSANLGERSADPDQRQSPSAGGRSAEGCMPAMHLRHQCVVQ